MDPNASAPQTDRAGTGGRELARALFGYSRRPVDNIVRETTELVASIEVEKVELAERIATLEVDLARRRELERLLRTSLISAERAADGVRQRASAEVDQIIEDAHGQARKLVAAALAERERVDVESGERTARLRTAFAILETELAALGEGELDEALLAQARRAAE